MVMEVWLLYTLTMGNPFKVEVRQFPSELQCMLAGQAIEQPKAPWQPIKWHCEKGGRA